MDGVAKSYRTGEIVAQVLRDVDLRIARDEFVVMFGVSGCGKTTLLNLIGALDVPSAGTIGVDGERISSMTERARTRFRAHNPLPVRRGHGGQARQVSRPAVRR